MATHITAAFFRPLPLHPAGAVRRSRLPLFPAAPCFRSAYNCLPAALPFRICPLYRRRSLPGRTFFFSASRHRRSDLYTAGPDLPLLLSTFRLRSFSLARQIWQTLPPCARLTRQIYSAPFACDLGTAGSPDTAVCSPFLFSVQPVTPAVPFWQRPRSEIQSSFDDCTLAAVLHSSLRLLPSARSLRSLELCSVGPSPATALFPLLCAPFRASASRCLRRPPCPALTALP